MDAAIQIDPNGPTRNGTARQLAARRPAIAKPDLLHEAYAVAHLGSWEWDPHTDRVVISDELVELTRGRLPQAPTVSDALAPVIPEHRERLRFELHRLAAGELDELNGTYPVRAPNPELRWVEIRAQQIRDPLGRIAAVRGTIQDVSARRLAEEQVELQTHLLDAVDAALIATDMDGRIIYWNAAAERMYGWSAQEVLGRPVTETTVGPADEATAEAIMEAVRHEGRWAGEFEVRRKDGSTFVAQVQDALVRRDDATPIGIVGASVDLTERLEVEGELRTARDYLRAVTESMGEGMYALDPEGRITYMNGAAERMLGWRSEEVVGALAHAATHYRRANGEPFPPEECPITAVCAEGRSIQVDDDAFVRKDGGMLPVEYTAEPLMTEAGRQGAVVVFTDITERQAERERIEREREALAWVGRIRDALDEDRFVLYAQPIIDLRSREVVRHELLLRMVAPDGDILPPASFLPTAERYGLITEIDKWVAQQAVALAAAGQPVAFNVSARSVGDPGASQAIERTIRAGAAGPGMLCAEVTETALIEGDETGQDLVRCLNELGCEVALDDFGTGYGGFTHLKQLPVSYLKIDVEFVRDLLDEPDNGVVVRAIVDLARGFKLRTVAEGVEDEPTLKLLEELGVDYVQGYGIARPASIDQLLRGPERDRGLPLRT